MARDELIEKGEERVLASPGHEHEGANHTTTPLPNPLLILDHIEEEATPVGSVRPHSVRFNNIRRLIDELRPLLIPAGDNSKAVSVVPEAKSEVGDSVDSGLPLQTKAFEALVEAVNRPHWSSEITFKDEITQAAYHLVVASGRKST